jgi:hypothetical protein
MHGLTTLLSLYLYSPMRIHELSMHAFIASPLWTVSLFMETKFRAYMHSKAERLRAYTLFTHIDTHTNKLSEHICIMENIHNVQSMIYISNFETCKHCSRSAHFSSIKRAWDVAEFDSGKSELTTQNFEIQKSLIFVLMFLATQPVFS